jgi:heme/copper-type cytochrome/quinol oxidase subunit 1
MNFKKKLFFYMVAVAVAMFCTAGVYYLASKIDQCKNSQMVNSFPDHSEITAETLKL